LMFVLLVKEIDLSVAAINGVCSVLMAKLIVDYGVYPWVSVPIAIALGAGIAAASVQTLRERAKSSTVAPGRLKARVVRGDVRQMHGEPEYMGALFQVGSQFNALEMVGPDVTRRTEFRGTNTTIPRVPHARSRPARLSRPARHGFFLGHRWRLPVSLARRASVTQRRPLGDAFQWDFPVHTPVSNLFRQGAMI